jgi:hypothetical protein
MAITASDIEFRLSGGSGNSDPNASLGGAISSTAVSGTALNNLFDNVSGDENAASDVEYRCFYVRNSHGSLTWESVVVWISAETAGGAAIAIGLGTSAVNGTEQTVANEGTAPTSVTFSAPTTKGAGLSIGNIPAGQHKAVWVRRTAANTAALDNDGATIRAEGDTAA